MTTKTEGERIAKRCLHTMIERRNEISLAAEIDAAIAKPVEVRLESCVKAIKPYVSHPDFMDVIDKEIIEGNTKAALKAVLDSLIEQGVRVVYE